MSTCGGNLQRPARMWLTLHVGQVGNLLFHCCDAAFIDVGPRPDA